MKMKNFFPHDFKLKHEEARKWFKLAKAVKEVESPCLSRQIGVVIVDPDTNSLISSGHNGPPQGCPGNDDADYLEKIVFPQLTHEEIENAKSKFTMKFEYEMPVCEAFARNFCNSRECPRKIVDAPRGKRLELCSCIHGEIDAIARANRSVAGAYMFCYCGVPCIECVKVIINAGIDIVLALDKGITARDDYSPYSSRFLLEESSVTLVLIPNDWIFLY